jgi:hypothetical protein
MVDTGGSFLWWHLVHSFIQNPLEVWMNEFQPPKDGVGFHWWGPL